MPAKIGMTQLGRALTIDTPLGADALLLRAVSGHEAISQLFRFQLELSSEDDSVKFESIIGKKVTIHVQTIDGERLWNGYISRFSQGGQDERFTYYRAEMVPWLWFLTRTADCRIFQRETVPDIIKQIFGDLGFTDFQLRLYKSYRKRDYIVQYRETDFNFVTRLMEEEGIFYFFEHDPKAPKHNLILGDDAAAHKPCPGQPRVRCDMASTGVIAEDVIKEWRVEQEYRPSAWAQTDYNFETPSASLMVTVKDQGKYEIYDYPGVYLKKAEGDILAKTRLEETLAFKSRITGGSNCRCFVTGSQIEVVDHYRKDTNGKYIVTALHHQVTMGATYHSGGSNEDFFYSNTFECIPAAVPLRPPRLTPKPSVQGCQTAIVVGPPGDEIFTDKYGRVKVKFHWDREARKGEDRSCWIRVSHPWAGKGWGAISIPRIGQEVIVDFLEGDPDQPIIVGRVYHAENMPPWGLPEKAVISGIKSDSTKGGGGYNEMSMDDTKGNELINVHAQYDQANKVEHDERTTIGHDRTESVGHDEKITIGNDRTEKVGHDERITIGNDRTEKVGRDEKISIGNNRTEDVGKNETITIGVNRTEKVGHNETISIGHNRTENVGMNEAVTVTMLRTHSVGINDMLNVGAAQEVSIGGAQAITVGLAQMVSVGMAQVTNVGMSQSVSVGKSFTLDAGESITLKTGDASITMSKDGTIAIKGKDIAVVASGDISEKASGNIVLKGTKIAQN